jgi:DNA-directed RNA polymerase specialized sigma24 family protein
MDLRRADFETFVSANADSLTRTAYLIAWDLQDAEDLVQETLLKVAARWHRVRRMEHPVAYARRILVNRALDDARRRARAHRRRTTRSAR